MPLLLTGEPGCGKSRLAGSLAWELGFPGGEPLVFTVKSDTEAKDLFYRFDTLGRFHAANVGKPGDGREAAETGGQGHDMDPRRFISYNALGKAILQAQGRDTIDPRLMLDTARANYPEQPSRSVVLIDEIDKAPREVPNDILSEIENMAFEVPELFHGLRVGLSAAQQKYRPVVVITSNSERELPPAFLRRCVFFHMELPPFQAKAGEVSIERIIDKRLRLNRESHPKFVDEALGFFQHLRSADLAKPPSLAELLDWLRYLSRGLPADAGLEQHPGLEASLGLLVKSHAGGGQAERLLAEWRATPRHKR